MQQEQLKQFAFVQEKLHATPLSMDDIVTLILLQQLKQATLTQLIEASAIPRTSMSRSLRKLSKLDLISESVDTHDLRKVNYTIAMKGDGVLYELMRGGNASAKVLLNGYRVLRKPNQAITRGVCFCLRFIMPTKKASCFQLLILSHKLGLLAPACQCACRALLNRVLWKKRKSTMRRLGSTKMRACVIGSSHARGCSRQKRCLRCKRYKRKSQAPEQVSCRQKPALWRIYNNIGNENYILTT